MIATKWRPATATGAGAGPAGYRAAVEELRRALAALPAGSPVRLAKPTSNLFRPRAAGSGGLDVSAFADVIAVDPVERVADVGGMTTYERLVDATLAHGLMPAVVPQLRTITLGGAVTGLGIESTSWRWGMPHETVREIDVLTATGDVVTATPDGERADLFRCFPNSYGSLGYALRLRIDLLPVRPYVRLRHVPFADAGALTAAVAEIAESGRYGGETVDFLDGTWFGASEMYLTLGAFADAAPYTSDYTGQEIFYRSIRRREVDHLTVRDYLWRWDTDWFWCSRAFGAQHPLLRRLWPRRWRRSDVYWRLVALENRWHLARAIDRRRGRPERESVVQDVEIPLERVPEFLAALHEETGISPVWLCPLRLRGDESWPLYPMSPGSTYVNVGFWATVPLAPGEEDGTHNRRIEQVVTGLGGHKSLYSTSFYARDEFWRLYNGDAYWPVKRAYDPAGRFADLYAKCVERA
ncbi:MAG: FAD-binding oxidoreductase [Frankiaceae bacterium]